MTVDIIQTAVIVVIVSSVVEFTFRLIDNYKNNDYENKKSQKHRKIL